MVTPSVGAVVVLPFPFSDLSGSKVRPGIVLAEVGMDDWILCQVTSNPYSDPAAIRVEQADFQTGSLQRTSYARPGKLFTANSTLMVRQAGQLSPGKVSEIIAAVVAQFRSPSPPAP